MTLSDWITEVNYNLRGVDDVPPSTGDEDWNYWVNLANQKKDEMYNNTSRNWSSSWSVQSLGTVIAATAPVYNLAADFISASDQVYIIDADGKYHYFDIIHPNERNRSIRQVYISGRNPQKLYFTAPIVAGEDIVGGTLYAPGHYLPADIDATAEDAVIPVDDPHWLAMAVAAELAFNDITYEDKFDDLNGKANVLWRAMSRRENRGSYKNPRITPTKVKRITGFR